MAVTRRQFVAGMSALAASLGFSSAQVAKITEALAIGGLGVGVKPKVLWVSGAACTGCVVSLLSLYEDARGRAVRTLPHSTLDALGLAADGAVPRTLATHNPGVGVGDSVPGALNVDGSPFAVNVQDILIDWIDLHYLPTVMNMGGDTAYRMLNENMHYTLGNDPFVLVVEGSTQADEKGGAWGDTGAHPWCSVGMPNTQGQALHGVVDLDFDRVVEKLATRPDCAAVISIGQCASFGGFPSAVSPLFQNFLGVGQGDNKGRQTGSMSTHEFLMYKGLTAAANKVVNVPGCPPNPWWFTLTVVCFLIDLKATLHAPTNTVGPLGILRQAASPGSLPVIHGGVDHDRRLNAVYGTPLHGPACARYADYAKGVFADNPGEPGCLQLIGCKGPSVNSLCGVHGWNGQQPENREALRGPANIDPYGVADIGGRQGGNCIMAGHPCTACTEAGYPDSFVPFVLR